MLKTKTKKERLITKAEVDAMVMNIETEPKEDKDLGSLVLGIVALLVFTYLAYRVL